MGDDANAAPTQAAPTELAPADYEAEAAFAWAFDPDDDTPTQRLTPRRITAAGVAVSLMAIAAAGVVALVFLRDRAEPAPVAAPSSSAPATSLAPITLPPLITSAPPPPPPPPAETTTVTAAAPPTTTHVFTPEEVAPYDRQFILNLQNNGWTTPDPDFFIDAAHRICYDLQEGVSRQEEVRRLMNLDSTLPYAGAVSFVSTASATYPGCP